MARPVIASNYVLGLHHQRYEVALGDDDGALDVAGADRLAEADAAARRQTDQFGRIGDDVPAHLVGALLDPLEVGLR